MDSITNNCGNISVSTITEDHQDINDQSDENSLSLAWQLTFDTALSMALKAAIELDILELIKKSEPNDMSSSEIAAQLSTNNPNAANMLDRLLRFLTAHSVLNSTLKSLPEDANIERRYSLSPLCKFLTKNEDGVSLVPFLILLQDKIEMEAWYHMRDAILEGGYPFHRAHGMSVFEYGAIDPRFNNIFNQAMSNYAPIFIKKFLEIYKGFEGVKILVDVGGGMGATINRIISKHPSIKGINFDLPHVIQNAPSYPGVKHIGGDMFVNVPKADAIFMKSITHDWSDAHCKKLLKNCYESLPKNGKLIIVDYIYPEVDDQNSGLTFKLVANTDLAMLLNTPGGKERTEKEFRAFAKEAGFNEFRKVCCALGLWIMELHK